MELTPKKRQIFPVNIHKDLENDETARKNEY